MYRPPQQPLRLPDLRRLQQQLLTGSVEQLAQTIVTEAAGTGGEDLSCGVVLRSAPDGALFTASSDGRAHQLDALQQSQREGPGLRALFIGRTVELDEAEVAELWPVFAERANDAGVRATLSVPLGTVTGTVGVLNFYLKERWNEANRRRAILLAEHVAPLVALAQRLTPLQRATHEETSASEINQLREQVTHDELTGLLNRRGIADLLTELMANGLRDGVAVLFCDLDNFKRINDGLGHDAGDDLLRLLARRLSRGLPPGCVPARLSGDEFVIICGDIAAVGGLRSLTTLVSQLLQATLPLGRQMVEISASVGASMVTSPGTTAEDLFRYADAAMFAAKDTGPAGVSVADPPLITTVDQQLTLEGDLRQALDIGGLELYYQPVVGARGNIVMAEALLRWPHPQHGMLSPAEILRTAHRGNLAARLDEYVLNTATREAASWTVLQPHPPTVAINMTTLPDDPRFSEQLTRIVERTGLEWKRLVLEITETPLASLSGATLTAMRGLTDRGLRFALDDFGTGYSSLGRLEKLPISIIKLDREFTTDLPSNPVHRGISTAVLAMASSMGHTCIAEGVETAAQYRILNDIGYPAYQGFLLCPPVPAHELHTLLTHSSLPVPHA